MESETFSPIPLEERIDPSELNDDEKSTLDFFSNMVLDGVSTETLAYLVASELFGEEMDNEDEFLFLSKMIDETNPIQSELVGRLCDLYETHSLIEPDRFSCQVFKRRAGFTAREKDGADLYEIGEYCCAICLKDYQLVRFGKEEYLISLETLTPVFELKPHPQNKKDNRSDRPSVPRNKTQIKLNKTRSTIKPRNYMSIVIWAFWDSCPTKKKESERQACDTSGLQEVFEKLEISESEIQDITPPTVNEEIVIFDSSKE